MSDYKFKMIRKRDNAYTLLPAPSNEFDAHRKLYNGFGALAKGWTIQLLKNGAPVRVREI